MLSFWADVCAHAGFFIAFLTVFYFTFVVYIQNNAMAEDIFRLLQDTLTSVVVSTDANTRYQIQQAIQTFESSVNPEQWYPSWVIPHNQRIKQAGIVVGITLPLILVSLALYMTDDKTGLFIGNTIVLSFLALSEFVIVGVFLSRFIEVNRDTAVAIIYKQLTRVDNLDCNFVHEFAVSHFGSAIANWIQR